MVLLRLDPSYLGSTPPSSTPKPRPLPPASPRRPPDEHPAPAPEHPEPALVAAVTNLTEQVEALNTAAANDLAQRDALLNRADHLEVQTEALLDRISALEILTPGGGRPATELPLQLPHRRGLGRRGVHPARGAYRVKWCTAWEDHLEARTGWTCCGTPGSAHAAAPGAAPNWAAVDEWTRVIFDHHTPKLLDVERPFAGCVPGERCSSPPGWPNAHWTPTPRRQSAWTPTTGVPAPPAPRRWCAAHEISTAPPPGSGNRDVRFTLCPRRRSRGTGGHPRGGTCPPEPGTAHPTHLGQVTVPRRPIQPPARHGRGRGDDHRCRGPDRVGPGGQPWVVKHLIVDDARNTLLNALHDRAVDLGGVVLAAVRTTDGPWWIGVTPDGRSLHWAAGDFTVAMPDLPDLPDPPGIRCSGNRPRS